MCTSCLISKGSWDMCYRKDINICYSYVYINFVCHVSRTKMSKRIFAFHILVKLYNEDSVMLGDYTLHFAAPSPQSFFLSAGHYKYLW